MASTTESAHVATKAATKHLVERKLVGFTIAFSVLCNDDYYRTSLAMYTDAASLSNFATLLQSMCLCA